MSNNIIYPESEVEQIIELKNKLIEKHQIKFQDHHKKTFDFIITNQLKVDDLIDIIKTLSIKDYCYSRYNNHIKYPKDEILHVFNTVCNIPSNEQDLGLIFNLYIKFKINNLVVVISFHPLEHEIKHPY